LTKRTFIRGGRARAIRDVPLTSKAVNLQVRTILLGLEEMSSIDVVIPVHNRADLTQRCLESLQAQTVPHTVIVCDNGSTDDTPARVRETFPDVRLVELGTNLGFAAACNRGVSRGSGEIVVLLNNDVVCRPNFLERVVTPFRESTGIGSVAALLLTPSEETIESFGVVVDPTLAGYPRLRDMPARDAQARGTVLTGPSGAAAAFRRRAWASVGGLDEGAFAYAEDVDLALRLRTAGWPTVAVPDAVAVHVGSATAVARSPWQRYQGGFARGYFLRRYGVLRGRYGPRAALTEGIVVLGDALVFSHDLAALRGRVAGWRAAAGRSRHSWPPGEAIDHGISFLESLRMRLRVYNDGACT
jgi:N-acetylglucosaminyl-diphospho-decaprenol L-rhamnosyltransferase